MKIKANFLKKLNLKKILKVVKLNESVISMVLGAVVIIITGFLVVNYFRDRERGSVSENGTNTEIGAGKMHTVAKGENLWTIAKNEIGSGYNWVDIAKANNLNNPGVISEGEELVIPNVEPIKLGQTEIKTQNSQTQGNVISGATYEVLKGDNLWSIAVRAYGDGFRWTQIAQENHLSNPGLIHAGNILALPR